MKRETLEMKMRILAKKQERTQEAQAERGKESNEVKKGAQRNWEVRKCPLMIQTHSTTTNTKKARRARRNIRKKATFLI